jgi:hypothetical protein
MILFRRLSFYLALAGLASAAQFVLVLYAQSSVPIAPPPITPPAKPFPRAIGASGLVEARRENILGRARQIHDACGLRHVRPQLHHCA